ncbi:hypothetical protein BPAE_0091g00090 [Botrytis paeoniae]|uniref:Uncharacterized protein n=1 Tax=Botrytis paeoniae TaxID=278948 RepID=A0A4Z1FPZ5_9HELO|nr:hypothetical protein BPAE_0091g00090 [Botrytis paeoniae]
MAAQISTSTTYSPSTSSTPLNFGRGGYNGPNKNDEDEDSFRPTVSSLRRGDDDEEEDGRGGYN